MFIYNVIPVYNALWSFLCQPLAPFYYFYFLQFSHCPLPVCPPTVPHPIPPTLCVQEDVPPTPARPPCSLGPQVSQGLGSSSPTKPRPDVRGLGLVLARVSCLVGSSVSEISGSRFVETAGLPIGLPTSSASSSLFLILPQGFPASVQWLCVSICIWLFQLLVGSLEGPPC